MTRSTPQQKVYHKAIGARRRQLAHSVSVRPTLGRNQILDLLAASYQRLGATLLPTMNDARRAGGTLDGRWVTSTLQPAVDALRAVGITPVDATVGAFRRAARLYRKDMSIFVFPGEDVVAASRIAGRCRGRKYSI